MKRYLGLAIIAICIGYFIFDRYTFRAPTPVEKLAKIQNPVLEVEETQKLAVPELKPATPPTEVAIAVVAKPVPPPAKSNQLQDLFDQFLRPDPVKKNEKQVVLPYVIDEGLAVVHGDIVIGRPVDDDGTEGGYAVLPVMVPWNTNVIPFHIQANFSNPARVKQALAMFEGTAIQFVPYQNQADVLVFEESRGVCKSYVGKIGGKQPIWISPDCTTAAIAHEIMHALGFIHEQNRMDRDHFIKVNVEAIDEKYLSNFMKLPNSFMKVSGQSGFDFESLMLYPTYMFAKGGHQTMQPIDSKNQIAPGERLSNLDIFRLNSVYGQ